MTAFGNSTPVSVANRVCTKCGTSKPETLEFFAASARSRGGLKTICRDCKREQTRARYSDDSRAKAREGMKAYKQTPEWRAWYVAARERRLVLKRKYRIQKAKADAHVKAWERVQRQAKAAVAAAVAAAARALEAQQKEDARLFFYGIGMKLCNCCKLLRGLEQFCKGVRNADGLDNKCTPCYVQRNLHLRRTDVLVRLRYNMGNRLRNVLKGMGYTKDSRTHEILGCDLPTFKLHLERQFTKGMAWELLGADIHIDHIVPMAVATTAAEVLALNHYTNLRPMWAVDNIRKGAQRLYLI